MAGTDKSKASAAGKRGSKTATKRAHSPRWAPAGLALAAIMIAAICLAWPRDSVKWATMGVGVVAVAYGAYRIYRVQAGKATKRKTGIFIGVIAIIAGLGMLLSSSTGAKYMALVLGIVAVIYGIMGLIRSKDSDSAAGVPILNFVRSLGAVVIGVLLVVFRDHSPEKESVIGVLFGIGLLVLAVGWIGDAIRPQLGSGAPRSSLDPAGAAPTQVGPASGQGTKDSGKSSGKGEMGDDDIAQLLKDIDKLT